MVIEFFSDISFDRFSLDVFIFLSNMYALQCYLLEGSLHEKTLRPKGFPSYLL